MWERWREFLGTDRDLLAPLSMVRYTEAVTAELILARRKLPVSRANQARGGDAAPWPIYLSQTLLIGLPS